MLEPEGQIARMAQLEARLEQEQSRVAELEARVEELRGSKDDFLAAMNHELRTPLNHIIGFTQIMLLGMTGELNDEQRTQLEMVAKSGSYLLAIVDDVNDLMAFNAGPVQYEENVFEANEVVSAAMELCGMAARERGLSLRDESGDPTIEVRSDRKRVRQVLVNLINNAIKFTPSGSVTVCARAAGDMVRFEVRDTGYGMTPTELDEAFQDFRQLAPRTRQVAKNPGAGLGLAISRRLVKLLGGRIEATSEPGEGSVFYFEVPRYHERSPHSE